MTARQPFRFAEKCFSSPIQAFMTRRKITQINFFSHASFTFYVEPDGPVVNLKNRSVFKFYATSLFQQPSVVSLLM